MTTCKEWAEHNAGRVIYPSPELIKGWSDKIKDTTRIGRCVGYSDVYVLIDGGQDSDDPSIWIGRKSVPSSYLLTAGASASGPFYEFPQPDRYLIAKREPAPVVKPYPNTCKVCRAPSRRIGALMLCSNGRCKSRGSIKKAYRPTDLPRRDANVDVEGYVICAMCKQRFQYSGGKVAEGRIDASGCGCAGHAIIDVKEGYKLHHPRNVFVWSENQWTTL